MRNNFTVTDSHCHIFPEKIVQKAVAGTDNFYGVVSCCKGTLADLIERGTAAGIDRFVVESVATTQKQVTSANDFISECVNQSGGRLIGLGTLYPGSDDIEGDYAHLRSLGLRGVKLHPDIQGFKIDDYRCLKIYDLCERDNMPVLMHTGDNRYDNSNPNRLFPVMKIYTGLTVIGAHFGGWSLWTEAVNTLGELPNLYVDCSSSFPYLTDEEALTVIRRYGADKVLFGTDFPMWEPEKELSRLLSLGLNDDELKKILSGNAEKLFGI